MMRQRQAEQNYLNAVRAAEQRLQAQAKAQTNALAKAQTNAAAQAEKDHAANLPPIDPSRVMDGAVVPASGPGWFRFWGKVQSATDEGLLLNGTYATARNQPRRLRAESIPPIPRRRRRIQSRKSMEILRAANAVRLPLRVNMNTLPS